MWVCFMLEREKEVEKEGDNEECLECGHALCLQRCVHPLHRSERERGRRDIEKERGRVIKRKRKKE